MNHAYAIRLATLCAGLVVLVVCSNDYNPFADNSNARMVITDQSFTAGGRVRIFSTQILELAAAVGERIDSFTVHADSSRYFTDTTVRRIGTESHTFRVSFTDTGWMRVAVTTFRSGGDSRVEELTVHAFSPLHQDTIRGYFGQVVQLATDSVDDKDVTYTWDFGRSTVVQSRSPRVKDTLLTADNESGVGHLYVSDARHNSPKVTFAFSLDDTAGPLIEWVNEHTGDTLVTGDTELPFKVRVEDQGGGPVHYVAINDTMAQGNRNQIYTALFTGLDAFPRTTPLAIIVYALDNLEFGNPARDTFWVAYDKSASRSAKTDLVIGNVLRDTVVTRTPRYRIFGSVLNYAGETVVVSLVVNGTEQGDTVYSQGSGDWSWLFSLANRVNTVTVTAADTAGAQLALRSVTIVHDPAAVDSTGPVFLEVSVNGLEGREVYTEDTAGALRIAAFDELTGIASMAVNGSTVGAVTGVPYLWTLTAVPLAHRAPGTVLRITAVDSLGNRSDTAVTVFSNRIPEILGPPVLPYPVVADSLYVARIESRDLDGDPVTVLAKHVPSGMTLLPDGTIRWRPGLTALGSDSITVQLFDTYRFSEVVSFQVYIVQPTEDLSRIRFTTSAGDLPPFLEANHDTLRVTLRVNPATGKPPVRYSARIVEPGRTLLDSTADSVVQWVPGVSDTGYRSLRLIVWDFYRTSDTIHAGVLVVPPNRPCTLGVTVGADTTATGALDLSGSLVPETLVVHVADPDLVYGPLAERHSLWVTQAGVTQRMAVDTTGSALVVLQPTARDSGYDTVRIIVEDRTGSRDTTTEVVYYGRRPGVPVLVSPADSAMVSDTQVTLVWRCTDPDGNPLTYDLYFGPPGAIVKVAAGAVDTFFRVSGLATSGMYYWYVVARDLKTETASAERSVRMSNPRHVRFATKPEDFPAFVQAGAPLVLTLRVRAGTGMPPFAFVASHEESGGSLLSGAADSTINWTAGSSDLGYQHLSARVTDRWGNGDTLRAAVLVVPANANACELVVSHDGPATGSGAVNMAVAAGPVTVTCRILDRDHILTERYTVRIFQDNTESRKTIDTTRQFEVIVNPAAGRTGYDTLRVIVGDRTGTFDTADVRIYYGGLGPVNGPAGITTGLVLWLRADTGVVKTGSNVTAWRDISGNGFDAAAERAGTGFPLAVLAVSSLNGMPGVAVGGASQAAFTCGDVGLDTRTDDFTAFVVYGTASAGPLMSTEDNLLIDNNQLSYYAGDELGFALLDTGILTIGQGNGVAVYGNGALVESAPSVNRGSLAAGALRVGMAATGGLMLDGVVAEVIVYSRNLPQAEREAVEAYLGFRYAVSLPHSYLRKVVVNTGSSGAALSSPVYNFPLLVRLTAANFDFTRTLTNGAGVRFRTAAGTPLPFEVERWDSTGRQAEVWVRVPEVKADDATQYFYLYVNAANRVDSSGAGSVFGTADDFAAVWHMAGDGTTLRDATANANHLGSTGTAIAAGTVDGARRFGVGDRASVADRSSLDITSDITLCAWVRPEGENGERYGVVSKRDDYVGYSFFIQEIDGERWPAARMGSNRWGSAIRTIRSNAPMAWNWNTWYHVAWQFDNTANLMGFFVNGNLVGSKVSTYLYPGNTSVPLDVALEHGDEDFVGIVDDIQLSRTARSDAWIRLSYETQRGGSTVVTVE